MDKSLHYKDIYLIPDYFDGSSRVDVITSQKLGNHWFELPVIPANMKCSISYETATTLAACRYPYIMHRFGDNLQFVKNIQDKFPGPISISIGVKENDIKLLNDIKANNLCVDYITIDIAHGHSRMMKEMISTVKQTLPNSFVIAGNIGTAKAATDLIQWGADAIKIGVGPGAVCTTSKKTGVVTPMFSTIQSIRQVIHKIPLIADGGISCTGDIVKALVAGANFVMCGKMFAELKDSPASLITADGRSYKEYYGSASEFNKGHNNNIEGKRDLLPLNPMTYLEKMSEIKQDLQSAISYAGFSNINGLKNMKWGVVQS